MTTKQFYLLILIGISFIGGTLLLLIWRQLRQHDKENRSSLFLSLAMFSWSIVGLYKYFDPPMPSLMHAINDRILSAFSNLFILASLPYFTDVFSSIKERFKIFQKPDQWVSATFLFFTVITAIFTTVDRVSTSDLVRKAVIVTDSLISIISLALISYALYHSVKRFWKDTLLKQILKILFGVLISTQLILPLISIFPEVLKPYYYFALILLLLSIVFFNFVAIAHFSLLAADFSHISNQITREEQTIKNQLVLNTIQIDYNEMEKVYCIQLKFREIGSNSNEEKVYELKSSKLLQPFANWIVFVLAKKLAIGLSHSDMSTIKFRMVELWNKDSELKLTQDMLFQNDLGNFDLKINSTNCHLLNEDFFLSKYIVRESVLRFSEKFEAILSENEKHVKLNDANVKRMLLNRLNS
jgi:hypothetical protein